MSDHEPILKRDIIVIGTSAGGVEALQRIVSELPKSLPAAVFIVMHVPGYRTSELPKILSRDCRLPISNPNSNQAIEPGRIYVAPADYHLIIEPDERIALWHGPKENNFRPAINPLFRSAADVYGSRVIGVILTGTLDEGVAGLAWVKRHNGIAIVQDPRDARFRSMPQSAMQNVVVDYVAPVAQIPQLLVELVNGAKPAPGPSE